MSKSKIDPGLHYRYMYRGVKLDPARIGTIYNVTHPMQMGILKKVLRNGASIKDQVQDIKDIIAAAERWLEMIAEDKKLAEQDAIEANISLLKGSFIPAEEASVKNADKK